MGTHELEELAERWRRARRAAVTALVGPARDDADERALFECATEVDARELHRRLFENGARLGESFARYHRRQLSLEELAAALPALGSPCTAGEWRDASSPLDGPVARCERRPCADACSTAVCDAWREAIDGLVVGLSGGLRHTRHQSRGHGDDRCVDVLYARPESPARFGTLPEGLAERLEPVARLVRALPGGVTVRWLGVSEGVFLWSLEGQGCGDGLERARALVEQTLRQKLPRLELRELGPQSVFERAGVDALLEPPPPAAAGLPPTTFPPTPERGTP